MEWKKMESHQNGFLKLKCFSPLKKLSSPLFEETLGAFFPFFHAPPLEEWGVSWYLRRKSLPQNFFLNGFNILAVDAYSRKEFCTPTWLNHDYGDGGVVDILAVDAYSGVEVCMTIFLGEASKISVFLGSKSFLKKFKTQLDTSLNKPQHKQSLLCG
jgi:hypothetical protein